MIKKLLTLLGLVLCFTAAQAQLPPPCPSNSFPPADLCSNICIYCNFNGIMSTTQGYTGQTPPGFCGTVENEQWLGFIASSCCATFTATATNCQDGNGVQIALYTDCNSNPIGCYGGCTGCAGIPAEITVSNMIPGVNYYLLIDGFAGDQCDITITVNPPSAVQAPPVGPPPVIQGATTLCPGGSSTYSFPPVSGAGSYLWTGPPGTLVNGMPVPVNIPAPDGENVEITFTGPVGGQVCVTPSNSCDTGMPACINIDLVPIPPTVLPPAVVCFEDAPYTTPWGQNVGASGNYSTNITTYQGCDSMVSQQVIIKPPIINNLPTQTICAGGSVEVCGIPYTEGGSYSEVCQSFQGCDSVIQFSVLVMDPIAEILGGGTLDCNTPSLLLNSAPTNAGIKIWKNTSGGVLGTGNTLTVTSPGTYILEVTASAGGVLCVVADTIDIPGDITPPVGTAQGGVIGCAGPQVQLMGSNNAANPSYYWTGPNGFESFEQNPIVGEVGLYTLVITNEDNGCTAEYNATVTGNTDPPPVNTLGATLDCNNIQVQISADSPVPNPSYSWTGPGGFNSNSANPTVDSVGVYTVTVTDQDNGCTSTATATVDIDDAPPGANAAGGVIDCNNPSIIISGNSGGNMPSFEWSGPGGFTSSVQNPSVIEAGAYVLTVTGSNGCTSTATADVVGNTNEPGAAATGGLIDCNGPNINLTGSSDSTNVSWSWTGPNGFTSSDQNPNVNTVGTYTLVVTGSNQCTSTATADITGDFDNPDASASGGVISCAANSTTISGSSMTPGATFGWTGPGNFMSSDPNPTVTNTGTYTLTVTAPNGCTSTATADVVPDVGLPDASADGGTLDCSITSITLDGNSNTPNTTLEWSGPNGFMSTDEDPTVTEPGMYVLVVTNNTNGCTAQATANVDLDDIEPGASAAGDTLTCSLPNFNLQGDSPTNNVSWSWSGPNGFNSTDQNPNINESGNYVLTVTGPNGCTSVASVDIIADQTDPVASASTDTLTCSVTDVVLAGGANTTVTWDWSGPNGFNSTDQSPTTNEPGSYILTITAANGCTDTETIDVPQNVAVPNVSATGNTLDCNNPSVSIQGASVTGGVTFGWSGPGGFTSNQASPTVNLDGDYTLTVTALNGCTASATVTVLIDTTTATLGANAPDTLTCSATDVVIQADVTNNGAVLDNLSWSGPNGFSDTVEDPTVMEPGIYNLVATMTNGCTSEVSVEVSQDISLPDVGAQGDTLTCAITSLTIDGISVTPGASYSWTGPNGFTSTDEDPTVNADGIYTLTVTGPNGCTDTADATVELDIAEPGANAVSSNDLDCDDLESNLVATSPTGSVTYDWGALGSTDTVIVNNPGTYDVIITGPNGCTSLASVTVDQDITPPGATAEGDTIDCISGIGDLMAITPTPGSTFDWAGPNGFTSTDQNPMVTDNGTYTVTVTGPNGCTSTATAFVEQNTDSPDVLLSGGGVLTCSDVILDINSIINTMGATGEWMGPNGFTSTDDTISISDPGTYTYTVEALNGCISAPTITVTQDITPPQDVVATGGLIDCNSPTINLGATTSTANVSYDWTGPGGFTSTDQNPAITNPGDYTVVVTNLDNGCTSTAMTTATQDPTVPDLAVSTDTLTCAAPTITIQLTTTTPNTTFDWTGPGGFTSTDEDPDVTEPGLYSVVATATSGCTSSFDITVPQDVVTPDIMAAGDTITCGDPVGTITGFSGTPGIIYNWSGPGGFTSDQPNPDVTLTGNYTLLVTAPNGCTNEMTVEVAPDASIPQITATGGTVTCDITTIDLTATSSVQNVTWQWNGPGGFTSTDQNPTVTTAGSYTLVVTAPNGCTNTTATTVDADTDGPDITTETPDVIDCNTISVTLSGSATDPGNYLYEWTTQDGTIASGANTQMPVVTTGGIYTLVVTNTANGCTSSENVPVLVDPATPSAAISQARDVSCFGETDGVILIEGVQGGTPPFLYSLNNSPLTGTVLYTNLAPGNYDLLIQDANGCELNTSFVIDEPEELVVELGADTTILLGQTIELSLDNTVNFPDRVEEINLSPSFLDTVLCDNCDGVMMPYYSFQYQMTVIDSNGCRAADSRTVIVDRTRFVYIPNIFDPESTGLNATFFIQAKENHVKNIQVFQVYDRWGAMVFEATDFLPNDPSIGWDGTVNGDIANPAVFVYYAVIEFIDGEIIVYKGDVTLMRQ